MIVRLPADDGQGGAPYGQVREPRGNGAARTAATLPAPLALDWLLPEFDATIVEHRVVDGDLDSVYRAIASVDMVEIPNAYPGVRALFAARGVAERLMSALLGRPAPERENDPMRLGDMPEQGEWVKLADEPPRELAFGVIGRFWDGETVWKTIDAPPSRTSGA